MKQEVVYEKGKVAVLRVIGQIEYEDREALGDQLEKFYQEGKKIVLLELEAMNYVGSAGIGIISKFHKHFSVEGKKLYLLNTQPDIRKIIDNIGLGIHLNFLQGPYEKIVKEIENENKC